MARHPHQQHLAKLTFNERLGLKITEWVGTMLMAYIFCMFAFVALPQAIATGSMTVLVNWASSNFLQLVLLPIILVGSNLSSKHAESLSQSIYEIDLKLEKHMEHIEKLLTRKSNGI